MKRASKYSKEHTMTCALQRRGRGKERGGEGGTQGGERHGHVRVEHSHGPLACPASCHILKAL